MPTSVTHSIKCSVLIDQSIQSAKNHRIFPSFIQTQKSRPLEFRSMPSCLLSLRLMFKHLKLESLGDVCVTRIVDTPSYSFLQTVFSYYFGTHGIWSAVQVFLLSFLWEILAFPAPPPLLKEED